jgi:hypothetical protein
MLVSIVCRIAAWWSVKNPLNASCSAVVLARSRPLAIAARICGSRWPAIRACIIARPDTPNRSLTTEDSLIWASSSSFSTRCISRPRSRISARR